LTGWRPPPAIPSPEDFRCEYIRKTGSNRKQRVCRSESQRRIESEASREAMRRLQRSGPLLPNN